MKVKKIITTSLISAAIIFGVGYLAVRLNGGPYIPREFFEQRIAGAEASKNVARLVSDSLANLAKIEAYDRAYNVRQASLLVAFERDNSTEKQAAAVLLASSLEKMAKATKDISPAEARQASLEVVTAGVAMVSHVINYNNYLDALFVALQAKLGYKPYSGPTVTELVANINIEAQAINEINQRFATALADFDQRFVK